MSLSKQGKLNYLLYPYDLSSARTDELETMPGSFDTLTVLSLKGAASLRISEKTNSSIDLRLISTVKTPFHKFYLTNTAQPGAQLILAVGGDAGFEPTPVITDYVRVTENIQERPITSRQRTGRAFFIDTFEHYTAAISEKWMKDGSVAGETLALATDYPKCGLNCMKLTTGVGIGDYVEAQYWEGLPPPGRFGLECEFQSFNTAVNTLALFFKIQYFDGTNVTDAEVKWLGEANKKWQYQDSGAVLRDITGGAQDIYIEAADLIYHNLKLVVDVPAAKYVSLVCDDKKFDLSAYAIKVAASAIPTHLRFCIYIASAAVAAAIMRVDNVVLTDMEP
jgi:hypothetical protein